MWGRGRDGRREGRAEICIVDTLTSWQSHSPKTCLTCVVEPHLGLSYHFLSSLFPGLRASWGPRFANSTPPSLEIMEEVKGRDPPAGCPLRVWREVCQKVLLIQSCSARHHHRCLGLHHGCFVPMSKTLLQAGILSPKVL